MPDTASIIAAADAIVTALAAASAAGAFSQRFTARRRYVPRLDLTETGSVIVTVVPKAFRQEQVTRDRKFKEFDLDLAIQKRLAQDADPAAASGLAAGDALMLLAEQVLDWFEPGRDFGGCKLLPTPDVPVVYDPGHLMNDKTFTFVTTLTLKKL
jgi:hypothetical protein